MISQATKSVYAQEEQKMSEFAAQTAKVVEFSRTINEIAEHLINQTQLEDGVISNYIDQLMNPLDNDKQPNRGQDNLQARVIKKIKTEYYYSILNLFRKWKHDILVNASIFHEISYNIKECLFNKRAECSI